MPGAPKLSLIFIGAAEATRCAKDAVVNIGAHLVRHAQSRDRRAPLEQRLGFGRTVVSEIEVPNMLANLV